MKKRLSVIVLILLAALFCLPASAQAAKKYKWTVGKKHVSYYDTNGQKLTGLKKIGKRKYLFNAKGYQLFGWQKIEGSYYYFRKVNGKGGYMFTNTEMNGITLSKSGKAVETSSNAHKLYALAEAQRIVTKAAYSVDSKAVKLLKTWNYFQKNYVYRGEQSFRNGANWESDYAWSVFLTGKGNCYALGATFAFLANACGYSESYAVSSGGHGWCEVSGRVFDPSWAKTDLKNNYYNMDMDLSGVNGRPNYKRARVYVRKI